MSHRNARTTLHGRMLIVQRHQQGWPQAHIAAAMGISRKCVHTWISRYAAEGEAGLHDRSSRPHHSPSRTSARVERQVMPRGANIVGARTGWVLNWALRPGPWDGFCAVALCPTCVTAIR
ncbi:hypothetical protein MMOR_44060 [Mycolicibacterium moriokaense]|uniref:Insertion element IS150 protein InsJ-like helix-turn-helix domain-containing protein n=1 Tax=Mycolicibacterium moriokaense TaxID=39691 RepID=A0AAD1HDY5_9MYCO|nr:hypothetical protein MMOR_39560 [Mycolicibacterium moriokaense]BBX03470.1 hypothetical protein MMOR_44060 [Mycolicibacterium moriokaense]